MVPGAASWGRVVLMVWRTAWMALVPSTTMATTGVLVMYWTNPGKERPLLVDGVVLPRRTRVKTCTIFIPTSLSPRCSSRGE